LLYAQQDTTKQAVTPVKTKPDTSDSELILDAIQITGSVDKPGVIIMSKRIEPELKKIDLERSFEREVKQGVGEITKPNEELRKVEGVKSIKKSVNKKRK